MENMLCDELLQEIFTRLPSTPSSSSSLSVSLVSKRWLHVYRTSRTSLSLRILLLHYSMLPSLSSLLSQYPSLSSLSLHISSSDHSDADSALFDRVLFVVSSSCSTLKHLRFLAGPVSISSLISLSKACNHLISLTVSLSRPLRFYWVASFPCLKDLSMYVSAGDSVDQNRSFDDFYRETGLCLEDGIDSELSLESLCLSGIRSDDSGVGWLWRSCKRLKKLQLKSCSGIGDGGSFSSFVNCLKGLEEIELRTCRSTVDVVLMKLAEHCDSLNSLLIYDGGSRDGLLQYLSHTRCNLRKLDLRLPLDLTNNHLSALSVNFRSLSTLRLQSCCLVTGDGLRTLGIAMSSGLEELALINCDVVEREPGLLSTLGQNLRQLRKLDLSYNEMLNDKELIAMLVSSSYLIELKLRGCRRLSNVSMVSMSKSCKSLENLDIVNCCGIDAEAVELFVMNSPRLRRLEVEENKISNAARSWASHKLVEAVI
ncbi:hypothetical protein Dsin_030919 [Dipteronia sinensis]|uniref:Uncharacterized protein n=1 Tax=Dipteronia sinensis TaxID=43782 RepID=A0AAE0DRP7_9ROSI|nr:hypothetical protein Dsin_030919 [Dipteronia sinensis]